MNGIDTTGDRQPQRGEEELRVHQQRRGLERGYVLQRQAVDGVGVAAIVFGRTRHIGSHDVDLLAAESAIHLVEPDGSTPLVGRKSSVRTR